MLIKLKTTFRVNPCQLHQLLTCMKQHYSTLHTCKQNCLQLPDTHCCNFCDFGKELRATTMVMFSMKHKELQDMYHLGNQSNKNGYMSGTLPFRYTSLIDRIETLEGRDNSFEKLSTLNDSHIAQYKSSTSKDGTKQICLGVNYFTNGLLYTHEIHINHIMRSKMRIRTIENPSEDSDGKRSQSKGKSVESHKQHLETKPIVRNETNLKRSEKMNDSVGKNVDDVNEIREDMDKVMFNSKKANKDSDDTSDIGKDIDVELPEEPTTCCMSGCANCVWIEYGDKLNELFRGESEKTKRIILEKVKDPNMKAFLQLELDALAKKNQEGNT